MTLARALRSTSLENPAVPLTTANATAAELWGDLATTDAGISVTEKSALTVSAVWRAATIISRLTGALPLHVHDRDTSERVDSPLLEDPHPLFTALEWRALLQLHRVLWGNAYALKVRNGAGMIVKLTPLMPWRMRVGMSSDGNKVFRYTDEQGYQATLTDRDVMHIPGLSYDGITGVSPVRQAAANAIGLAKAAEMFGAKFFAKGALMSGILQTEQRLTKEQSDQLKNGWRAKQAGLSNAYDIAVLDSGAKFTSVSMPNADAQFLETRSFQVPEIARFMGVPPFLLMDTEKSTSWGTGLEQQAIGFVKFDLHPTWLAPMEQRFTMELIAPIRPRQRAKFSIDGLMRGDSAARGSFYRIMREVGAYSANDIRDFEDLPAIDGGDTYLQPLNLAPLGYNPTQGAQS